jgi:hypothetical protein
MNLNNSITNDSNIQQVANNLWGVMPSGSVVSGLLCSRVPNLRETIENLKIFPEAKEYLEYQIKLSKKILKQIDHNEKIYRIIIENKSQHPEFWKDLTNQVLISPYRTRYSTILKRNILALTPPTTTSSRINVDGARDYPLTDLLEFKNGKAKCIFHNDRNPSLQYYPKTNSCYCFSCQTSADSIKVYQTLNNCSFIEAVKALQC